MYQIYNDSKDTFANNKTKYPFVSDAIFTAKYLHDETGETFLVVKAGNFVEVWDTKKDIPEELLDF